MKAFFKTRGGLFVSLIVCVAVIAYVSFQLGSLPETFQRTFLPSEQTARDGEDGPKGNQYLRDLIDKTDPITAGLKGACEPASLYAVAQPATISAQKQNSTASARLVGIDESYLALEHFALYGGRYFYPDEYLYGQRVALIDEQLAVALFQYAEPLLEEIQLGGQTYRIIGIVRDHKRVGDEMEYSAYVPYRSLIASDLQMTEVVYEAAPVKGSGGWASFVSATAGLGDAGSVISLPKETMNAAMPLRLLGVLCGGTLGFFAIGILNRVVRRLVARYRAMLRDKYAVQLFGWLTLRGLALALGYGLCIFVLAQVFVVMIAPVYTFPEWVPAILVEPKDIAAAFWNVWQKSATAVELRTPELLRVRFFARLMGWACGFCGIFLGVLWGGAKDELLRLCHMEGEPIQNEED